MSTKMARVKEVPKGELIRIKYDAYEVWPDHCAEYVMVAPESRGHHYNKLSISDIFYSSFPSALALNILARFLSSKKSS